MKKYDVVALGELLIDFTENGESTQGNRLFEANPGGAPCNVLAMLQKLNYRTAFIGKVGQDMFGMLLKNVLLEVGIGTAGLCFDGSVNTTLAFVRNNEDGDRDFSFYRNPGADMMLTTADLQEELLSDCRLFHFGTLSMTSGEAANATRRAVELAKKAGAHISFDPNIRKPLWNSMEDAKKAVEYGMQQCDILKISDDEILWFTGMDDYEKAASYLCARYQIPLLFVSLGADGSMAFCKDNQVYAPAFRMNGTIDTTGAGDTFMGCVLSNVLEHGLTLSEAQLKQMLMFANAAAALITTRKGALRVMPAKDEILHLIKSSKNIQ